VSVAGNEVGSAGMAQSLVSKIAQRAYKDILENNFSRDDEMDADEKGVQLANKIGYAPNGLSEALKKLADRNKESAERNGLFASHPLTKERLTAMETLIREKKLSATATVQARYAKNITFDAKPVTAISTVAAGARGLAGGDEKKSADADKDKDKSKDEKKEEPKKSGGMLSRLKPGGGSQAQQSQTVASGGARGVNPDRDAVGGPNKNRVPVKITPGELTDFQKGITA
jgi:predicted Zn-dependent protease